MASQRKLLQNQSVKFLKCKQIILCMCCCYVTIIDHKIIQCYKYSEEVIFFPLLISFCLWLVWFEKMKKKGKGQESRGKVIKKKKDELYVQPNNKIEIDPLFLLFFPPPLPFPFLFSSSHFFPTKYGLLVLIDGVESID